MDKDCSDLRDCRAGTGLGGSRLVLLYCSRCGGRIIETAVLRQAETTMNHSNANDGIRLFAKGGIAAAITINSGALLGTFAKISEILPLVGNFSLRNAISFWSWGVALGSVAWIFAALAASAYANSQRKTEITFGAIGYISVILSIGAFLLGFMNISAGISLYPRQ